MATATLDSILRARTGDPEVAPPAPDGEGAALEQRLEQVLAARQQAQAEADDFGNTLEGLAGNFGSAGLRTIIKGAGLPARAFNAMAQGYAEIAGSLSDSDITALKIPLEGEDLLEMANAVGLAEEPKRDTFALRTAEKAGEFATIGGLTLLGLGPAAGRGKLPTLVEPGKFERTRQLGRNIRESAVAPVREAPGQAFLAETSASLGGAAASEGASQLGLDDPASQTLATLAGAVVSSALTPQASLVKLGQVLNKPVGEAAKQGLGLAKDAGSFLATGGQSQAEKNVARIVQANATNKETALKNLGAVQREPSELIRGGLEAPETGAQAAQDFGLLTLERTAARSTMEDAPRLGSRLKEQQELAPQAAREATQTATLGRATPTDAGVPQEIFQARRTKVLGELEGRARQAIDNVKERVSGIFARTADIEDSSRVMREELGGTLKAMRAQESVVHGRIDRDLPMSTSETKAELGRILSPASELEKAGKVPGRFVKFIGKLNPADDAGKLLELRSEILAEIRDINPAKKGGRALIRNLTRLQKAILKDVGVTRDALSGANPNSKQAQLIEDALSFSTKLNDMFTRGPIGKVLGYQGGEQKVADILTLDKLFRPGREGGVAADQVVKVLEQAKLMGGPNVTSNLRKSARDFMERQFHAFAVDDSGAVVADKANMFLRRYGSFLERFPQLKQEMGDLESMQRLADKAGDKFTRMSKLEREQSAAAVFIKHGPVDAMAKVMRTAKPWESMQALLREAGRDKSGDAVRGLKSSFLEYMMPAIKTPLSFEKFLSAPKVKRVMSQLYTPDEIKRIGNIKNELGRIKASERSALAGGSDTAQNINYATLLVARVIGARVGAGFGTIQSAGLGASAGKAIVTRLNKGQTERLLMEVIMNPAMMERFLKMKVGKETPEQIRALRSFVFAAGFDDAAVEGVEP